MSAAIYTWLSRTGLRYEFEEMWGSCLEVALCLSRNGFLASESAESNPLHGVCSSGHTPRDREKIPSVLSHGLYLGWLLLYEASTQFTAIRLVLRNVFSRSHLYSCDECLVVNMHPTAIISSNSHLSSGELNRCECSLRRWVRDFDGYSDLCDRIENLLRI